MGKKLTKAVNRLATAITENTELRRTYQSNIAVAFQDEYNKAIYDYPDDAVSDAKLNEVSNNAANRFLQVFCGENFKPLDT